MLIAFFIPNCIQKITEVIMDTATNIFSMPNDLNEFAENSALRKYPDLPLLTTCGQTSKGSQTSLTRAKP